MSSSGWNYDEEILTTCQAKRVSWLPGLWRPVGAGDSGGPNFSDLNGASVGKFLDYPTSGKVGNFATLGTLTVVRLSSSLTFILILPF